MPRRFQRCDRADEITCTPPLGDAAIRAPTPAFIWFSSAFWQMMLWRRGPARFGLRPRRSSRPDAGVVQHRRARTFAVAASTRSKIALRQRPTSGFTLGSAACACDADRIATTRCIGPAEQTQMPVSHAYDSSAMTPFDRTAFHVLGPGPPESGALMFGAWRTSRSTRWGVPNSMPSSGRQTADSSRADARFHDQSAVAACCNDILTQPASTYRHSEADHDLPTQVHHLRLLRHADALPHGRHGARDVRRPHPGRAHGAVHRRLLAPTASTKCWATGSRTTWC